MIGNAVGSAERKRTEPRDFGVIQATGIVKLQAARPSA
jgi:hypothetical protein